MSGTLNSVLLLSLLSLLPVHPGGPARPGAAQEARPTPPDFTEIPGERELTSRLIVRPRQERALVAAGLSREQARALHDAARREVERRAVLRRVPQTDEYVVLVPGGDTDLATAEALLATGLFEYVEPDWLLYPVEPVAAQQAVGAPPQRDLAASPRPALRLCPDDPLFGAQWHHQTNRMRSCEAWARLTGGPAISVGVCDTGVRTTHEDLLLHRLEGYNAVDRLWESQGGNINPVYPHGTRTTGTVAANGDNGKGIAGVGWNLSHRMVRVSNMSNGGAFLSDLQHGARTSIESGDRVANVSYHGASSASNPATAAYIESIGGLLLWAAGNTSANLSHADRDSDDLIVVGATDQGDNLASFSAYGRFVDLVAPGVGIVTSDSFSDTSYKTVEGTSYACPLTAGVCAMIWSARPNLSPGDVEYILKHSTDDLGAPGTDDVFGYGRIDLASALELSGTRMPAAAFSGLPASGRSPLDVSFRDLSTGVPTAWLWDLGDGTTSTAQSPAHTYTSPGRYTVSLTVTNAVGSDTTTQVDYVLVDVIPPVADLGAAPTAGVSPLAVSFTDLSTGGLPTSWAWTFGDGATSTLQDPSHTYTASGRYTVSLTATNAYGSSTATYTDLVVVDFIPPQASFVGQPTSGASPLVVAFTDQSTGGVATSWSWSFGDGATSTAQHPTHTYTAAGSYTVRLVVSNAYGSDTLVRSAYVQVSPGPPIVANFTGSPTLGPAPLTVAFTDLSIGNVIAWDWNFGDGVTSTLQHPTHVFTAPGEYDVALQVTNPDGKDDQLELKKFVVVQ